MAYIVPDSDIYLLAGVPLDNTYDHTVYFAGSNVQHDWFSGYISRTFSNQYYQRYDKGTLRLKVRTEQIYDCNYLMFRNTAYGDKWFYAFITSTEWINNEVTEIRYQIDSMQTWYFDYKLNACFVEREHSASDLFGENILPEGVDTGEYIYNEYSTAVNLVGVGVVVAIVDLAKSETVSGGLVDNTYQGADYYYYKDTELGDLNTKLADFIQRPESIVSMHMIPQAIEPDYDTTTHRVTPATVSATHLVSLSAVDTEATLDGYKPKNKKMYTYPYNYCMVFDGSGGSLPLRYEFCRDRTPRFRYEGTITAPVEITVRPIGYKGLQYYSSGLNPNEPLMTETMKLSGFPMCSWATNTFEQWLSQNYFPIISNAVEVMVGGAMAGAGTTTTSVNNVFTQQGRNPETGRMVNTNRQTFSGTSVSEHSGSGGASVVGLVTNTLNQAFTASIAADQCRGSQQNGGSDFAHSRHNIYSARLTVSQQVARSIDQFFSMFGYKTNKLKVPNTHVRSRWTYTKTINCNAEPISGRGVPNDAMREICSIYDKGITFWRSTVTVGEYTDANGELYDNGVTG